MAERSIQLTEEALIGQGCHKKVYAGPKEPDKCAKIIYNADGQKDIERELGYRRYRQRKNMSMELVPEYYGTVDTNLGCGYLYERIIDCDGTPSATLRDCVRNIDALRKHLDNIISILLWLRQKILDDELITMGITDENILFKKKSPNKCRVYLISDLGTSDFIPITRLHYFAVKKIKRKWQRLIEELQHEVASDNRPYLTAIIKAISY